MKTIRNKMHKFFFPMMCATVLSYERKLCNIILTYPPSAVLQDHDTSSQDPQQYHLSCSARKTNFT